MPASPVPESSGHWQAEAEEAFARWHDPRWLGTDPLGLVRAEPNPADREALALCAAALALGRVQALRQTLDSFWGRLKAWAGEAGPVGAFQQGRCPDLARFEGLKYRFFGPAQFLAFAQTLAWAYANHGSLEGLWRAAGDLAAWADRLYQVRQGQAGLLLVQGSGGNGVFKRWRLFLRWMVRCDAVDPGGWSVLNPADLAYPVDTHLFRWASRRGLTRRRTPDARAVAEITESFRALDPADPVRFDFALTRPGILSSWT